MSAQGLETCTEHDRSKPTRGVSGLLRVTAKRELNTEKKVFTTQTWGAVTRTGELSNPRGFRVNELFECFKATSTCACIHDVPVYYSAGKRGSVC